MDETPPFEITSNANSIYFSFLVLSPISNTYVPYTSIYTALSAKTGSLACLVTVEIEYKWN